MPVDVAVEEPGAGVVRLKADCDVVARRAGGDNIALGWVDVVVVGAAGAADNPEGVLWFHISVHGPHNRRREVRTYTVEMERMRRAGRVSGGDGERDLDARVGREAVDGAVWKQLARRARTAQDLEEHGHGGRHERLVVDEEVRAVEAEVHVDRDVHATLGRLSGRGKVRERDQVRLVELERACRLVRRGVDVGGATVAEDSRVDSAVEASGTDVGVGADPVVVNVLIRSEDERVPLPGEDGERIDNNGLVVDAVSFNDSHVVTIDGERVVRVARNRDEADAVALALGNADDGKRSVRPVAPGVATQPIDQS